MSEPYVHECHCGRTHRSSAPGTPPGWLIGRDGRPVCDDCASARRARQQRRAA